MRIQKRRSPAWQDDVLYLPSPYATWELQNNKAVIYTPHRRIGLDEEATEVFIKIIRRIPVRTGSPAVNRLINKLIKSGVIIPYNPEEQVFFPPAAVAVEITHRCNLRCKYCYVGNRSNPQTLSLEAIKHIIDDMRDLQCTTLILGGGEPTLHPQFDKILEYAYKKGMTTHIVTNGTTDLPDYLEKYSSEDRHRFGVTISLDSPKEIHEEMRKNAKFEIIERNIHRLAELGWKPSLQTTVSLENYRYIPDLLKLIKSWPVKSWVFKMEYPVGNAKYRRALFPSSEMFVMIKERINKWCDESGINSFSLVDDMGYFPSPMGNGKRRTYYLCSAGVTQVTLDAEGNVTPCTLIQIADGGSRYIAGNIYEDSLRDIWHRSKVLWDFRLMWPENEICSSCGLLCAKCPATVIEMAGDIRKPDPRCSMSCIWGGNGGSS